MNLNANKIENQWLVFFFLNFLLTITILKCKPNILSETGTKCCGLPVIQSIAG